MVFVIINNKDIHEKRKLILHIQEMSFSIIRIYS